MRRPYSTTQLLICSYAKAGVIEGYGKSKVDFTYAPLDEGSLNRTLLVKFAARDVEDVALYITGACGDVPIYLESEEIDFKCCVYDQVRNWGLKASTCVACCLNELKKEEKRRCVGGFRTVLSKRRSREAMYVVFREMIESHRRFDVGASDSGKPSENSIVFTYRPGHLYASRAQSFGFLWRKLVST
jgi:hypothetical protein